MGKKLTLWQHVLSDSLYFSKSTSIRGWPSWSWRYIDINFYQLAPSDL